MQSRLVAATLAFVAVTFSAPALGVAAPKKLWRLEKGLETPNSAFYDAASDRIYVSSINGDAMVKDGVGWISTVRLDGSIDQEKWAQGFHAPKGLVVRDGTLWVTDIDEVVALDVKTAKETQRVRIPNATFLNDLAIADDGTIYVSDMLGLAIYEIKAGKAEVFLEGPETESPNGLYVDGPALRVVSWASGLREDFSTEGPGRMYTLDRKTKKKTVMTKPLGNLDGLEKRDGKAGWLLADGAKGTIYAWSDKGKGPLPLLVDLKGPAGLSYVAKGKLLLVPEMNGNALTAFALAP